jgi:hypothetical protein
MTSQYPALARTTTPTRPRALGSTTGTTCTTRGRLIKYDCPKCNARKGQLWSISKADDVVTEASPVREWSEGWRTHWEQVCLTGCALPARGEINGDPLNPYRGGHFESKR